MASIQVRNVPPDVHLQLKERAARSGLSLNEFLLRELRRVGNTLTVEEVIERARRRGFVRTSESSADVIRTDRDHGH
jgi:antitoxin FitA